MTPTQFEAVAKLIGLRSGPAQEFARLLFGVGGLFASGHHFVDVNKMVAFR